MINKVYEVIEAKKIFNLSYNQIEIKIHPKSYIHAIIKFKDGMIKLIAHDTTMEIPIFNTLENNNLKSLKTKKINFDKLNNLNFSNASYKKFPITKIIKKLPKNDSLFETIIVSANDELVSFYLNKKITYINLLKKLSNFVLKKEFIKYKSIEPRNITDILNLDKKIKLKIKQYV